MKIDPLKTAAWITTIGSAVFMLNVGYDHFQKARDATLTEFSIRGMILDKDLKKDAEAVVYYKNKSLLAPLDAADAGRLEYLEGQLEQKQVDRRELQARKNALEDK